MKKQLVSQPVSLIAGALLVIPTMFFIFSALLNYQLNIPGPWSLIGPIFEKPGNKQVGLNINLLILFGPVLGILINLPQVMDAEIKREESSFSIQVYLKKYSWCWLVIAAGLFCLAALFIYLLGENCKC